MKLRNKFLFVFFILLLIFCLAFVSSASDYFDYSNVDPSKTFTQTLYYNNYNYSSKKSFSPSIDVLGLGDVACGFNVVSYGFYNIEAWHYIISLHGVDSAEDLAQLAIDGVSYGYWSDSAIGIKNSLSYFASEYWTSYQEWYNSEYFYSYVDCQNFHIMRHINYSFEYNGNTYNSVIEAFCPLCGFARVELSSDVLVFLDDFSNSATADEIENFDFYTTLRLNIFEGQEAYHDVSNLNVLEDFIERLEKISITKAHEFTSDWLSDNGILYEPHNSNGDFESFGNLLGDNYAYSIDTVRINTLNHSINVLENWLKSKDLEIKDYINDGSVNAIDNLVAANFDSAYSDWVKEGRSDAILRLSTWLSDNDLKYSSFENSGLLSDIDNGLNLNVLPALDARQAQGYSNGQTAGVLDGKTQMYNELMGYINTSFGTEYPTSDGTSYDFTVPSQAYTVAYEAGELYQLNKFTDDGGISDFLADISGTILSTFFYLGTNISFMGTTALSLISLFVIAAMVIFALKFFKY